MTWQEIELATSPEPAFAVLIPSHTSNSDSGPLVATNRQSWFVCVSRTFMRPTCES